MNWSQAYFAASPVVGPQVLCPHRLTISVRAMCNPFGILAMP